MFDWKVSPINPLFKLKSLCHKNSKKPGVSDETPGYIFNGHGRPENVFFKTLLLQTFIVDSRFFLLNLLKSLSMLPFQTCQSKGDNSYKTS